MPSPGGQVNEMTLRHSAVWSDANRSTPLTGPRYGDLYSMRAAKASGRGTFS